MGLNVVAIVGRLVADPQLRQTNGGKNVASFRVAVDRNRKDPSGQTQADFLDVVAWEKTADFVCRYFQKGSMIAIDGRLQSRNYQDRNGNNRQAVEIVANGINFAGSKVSAPSSEPDVERPSAPSPATYAAGNNDDFALIEDDGDLPF